MLFKKKGLPEEGEYVLCTVKKILFHSVFADLDEYDHKEGMIHISEVSPGRIRNLRDYVREGKKIVCKVLRVRLDKGQIDLSLRRVSVAMRKKKNTELKQEQKAEKIMEIIAQRMNLDVRALYQDFGNRLWEEYGGLNPFFQEISSGGVSPKDAGIPQKYADVLVSVIHDKIKPQTVEIEKELELRSEAPDGIDLIKKALGKALELAKEKSYDVKISYISAPRYHVKVSALDHKCAQKVLDEVTSAAINSIVSSKGHGEVRK